MGSDVCLYIFFTACCFYSSLLIPQYDLQNANMELSSTGMERLKKNKKRKKKQRTICITSFKRTCVQCASSALIQSKHDAFHLIHIYIYIICTCMSYVLYVSPGWWMVDFRMWHVEWWLLLVCAHIVAYSQQRYALSAIPPLPPLHRQTNAFANFRYCIILLWFHLYIRGLAFSFYFISFRMKTTANWMLSINTPVHLCTPLYTRNTHTAQSLWINL